jgi:alpha-tubulin suppressor-like RCC1 family protein
MDHKSLFAAVLASMFALAAVGTVTGASSTGNAWAWGLNSDGELGNGTVTPYSGLSTPGQVVNLSHAVAVAGGDQHSVALRSDGTVWAWGNNGWGQLGNGTYTRSLTPTQVSGLTNVKAIAAGQLHNLALKTDGTVWAWGFNYFGQVRIGSSGDRGNVLSPVQVTGLAGVIAVAAGGDTSFALKSDGTVWAWGYDGQGQLGNGASDEDPHGTPTRVKNLSTAMAIGAGVSHALAVRADGTVSAWGDNQTSELGATTTSHCSVYQTPCSPVPVAVVGLSGVAAVAGGWGDSLALKSDGTAWGWGSDGYGELGNGKAQLYGGVKSPVKAMIQNVVAIAAGASWSLWLRSDGTVWGAGANNFGQLGDGTFKDSVALVQVKLSRVFAVATGHSHGLAVRTA